MGERGGGRGRKARGDSKVRVGLEERGRRGEEIRRLE